MNNLSKNIAIWLIIAVVLMTVFNQFGAQRTAQTQLPYSQFLEEVRQQQITKRTTRPVPAPLDLRTPTGRRLPF